MLLPKDPREQEQHRVGMHILNLAQSLIALDVAQLGGFRRPVPVCLCGGEGVAG